MSSAAIGAHTDCRAGLRISELGDVAAVFYANCHMALGLRRALYEAGRSIPGDIGVVVDFDDASETAC